MGLMKCRVCSQNVSSDAKSCPHCGTKKFKKSRSAIVIGIVFFFFSVLGLVGGKNDDTNSGSEEASHGNSESGVGVRNAKNVQIKKDKPASPLSTWRWAFNPALGCLRQNQTAAEIMKKEPICKVEIKKFEQGYFLLRCPIQNDHGVTMGNLDYVFTPSSDACEAFKDWSASLER
jgi:hypothetical protein